jgi:hypothetical protein
MLGRISVSPHDVAGHRCGECEIGWPRGRRAQKRREDRECRRDLETNVSRRRTFNLAH